MESSLSLRRVVFHAVALACMTVGSAVSALAGSVTLSWTAPGDDSLSGRAARYDLRCSLGMLTSENFVAAKIAAGLPRPGVPGTTQSVTIDGLEPGLVYYFAMKTGDVAGNWSAMSNVVARRVLAPTAAIQEGRLSFSAPQPNPARSAACFEIVLPGPMNVWLGVFDVTGRRVRRLIEGPRDPGAETLTFDLRDDAGARLPPGVYLVRARLGETTFVRRLVVAR
jgi:hypothetical protein